MNTTKVIYQTENQGHKLFTAPFQEVKPLRSEVYIFVWVFATVFFILPFAQQQAAQVLCCVLLCSQPTLCICNISISPSVVGVTLLKFSKLCIAVSFLKSMKRQQQLSHLPETNAYKMADSSATPNRLEAPWTTKLSRGQTPRSQPPVVRVTCKLSTISTFRTSLARGVGSGQPTAVLLKIFSWLSQTNIEEIYYLNCSIPWEFSSYCSGRMRKWQCDTHTHTHTHTHTRFRSNYHQEASRIPLQTRCCNHAFNPATTLCR